MFFQKKFNVFSQFWSPLPGPNFFAPFPLSIQYLSLTITNTLDFPEVVHQEDCPHKHEENLVKFRTMCTECGGICCYADDSTYILSAKTTEELSTQLESKFKGMSNYLTENRLCINLEKTHLLSMSTRQKKRNNHQPHLTLNTKN